MKEIPEYLTELEYKFWLTQSSKPSNCIKYKHGLVISFKERKGLFLTRKFGFEDFGHKMDGILGNFSSYKMGSNLFIYESEWKRNDFRVYGDYFTKLPAKKLSRLEFI